MVGIYLTFTITKFYQNIDKEYGSIEYILNADNLKSNYRGKIDS